MTSPMDRDGPFLVFMTKILSAILRGWEAPIERRSWHLTC